MSVRDNGAKETNNHAQKRLRGVFIFWGLQRGVLGLRNAVGVLLGIRKSRFCQLELKSFLVKLSLFLSEIIIAGK